MEDKKKSQATRVAVIGMIGTILTVCSGLTGAAVSAGVTVYQVERERQQVALAAPGDERALTIDTQQIAINQKEAQQLDPNDYAVAQASGFVLAQPRAGWSQVEEMTYADLFMDEGALSPLILFSSWVGSDWDEQPVHRTRHEESVPVQYQEGSEENGVPVDVEVLQNLAGTDTLAHYSQIIVLAIDQEVAADYTLAEIALAWGTLHRGGVNRVVANKGSQYILMQATWRLENVRIAGRETDLAIERWALFSKWPQHYYVAELNYVPPVGQPIQVWQDLQVYMDSFRIIQ